MKNEIDDFYVSKDYYSVTPWDKFCVGLVFVVGIVGILIVVGTIINLLLNLP